MEIVPTDASLFRSAIEGLKEFLPNAELRISADCLKISGMDASHVGFVDYVLSKADCEVLKCKHSTVIGVNMAHLSLALANVGAGDKIAISTSKAQDKLVVSYTNTKMGKKALYEIPVMDIRGDVHDLPALTYGGSVSMKTSDIVGAIKEVARFGDAVEFRLDDSGFVLSASGDMGSVKQTLENTDDREMTMNTEEDTVFATFATKYILSIMKAGAPLSATTVIEFDGTQPMRAAYKFGSASHFVAYLAPKIMEE
jgi:proliferating cell nuclear antigen PCNA